MYVTLGLMVGRGPNMSFSSMQTVYSCKKSQLSNPGFSGQRLISSDVISEFPLISVGNCWFLFYRYSLECCIFMQILVFPV